MFPPIDTESHEISTVDVDCLHRELLVHVDTCDYLIKILLLSNKMNHNNNNYHKLLDEYCMSMKRNQFDN
jgi:hypothetical protein